MSAAALLCGNAFDVSAIAKTISVCGVWKGVGRLLRRCTQWRGH
jgi:hypothetical protein